MNKVLCRSNVGYKSLATVAIATLDRQKSRRNQNARTPLRTFEKKANVSKHLIENPGQWIDLIMSTF